jgi:hypothetical protein
MFKQATSSQASFSLSCDARCSRPLDAHEGAAGIVSHYRSCSCTQFDEADNLKLCLWTGDVLC